MTAKTLHSANAGRQLSVFLDDRPGSLAEACETLGRSGINIHALALAEGVGHGYVRMVVDHPDEALRVLKQAEELTMEREVILLELANSPGSLAAVARKLGDSDINIEYAYCAAGPNVDKGLIVIRVDQTEKALGVLKKLMLDA